MPLKALIDDLISGARDSLPSYKLVDNEKYVELTVAPLPGEHLERQYLVILNNVTSIKKVVKQQEQNRFRNVYFAGLAHDLRTPINSVLSVNYTLLAQLNPEQQHLVKVSTCSCQFLLSLIDDMIDYSKIEFGVLDI